MIFHQAIHGMLNDVLNGKSERCGDLREISSKPMRNGSGETQLLRLTDRIGAHIVLKKHFKIPENDRFTLRQRSIF